MLQQQSKTGVSQQQAATNNGPQVDLPPRSDLRAEFKLITPDLAREFLAESKGNRSMKKPQLERLCRDARANNFHTTHHAIAFDDRGFFVDGHHRLEMIIRTGLAQTLLVCYGISQEALAYIDAGVPRTLQDSIQLAYLGTSKTVPSKKECAVAGSLETVPSVMKHNYTRPQVIKVFEQGEWAIRKACSLSMLKSKAVRTLIARAYLAGENEDRIDEFCRILVDGLPVSDHASEDSAAILYRNHLLKTHAINSDKHNLERYRKGQKALFTFLQREPLKALREQNKNVDFFPLPDSWTHIRPRNEPD